MSLFQLTCVAAGGALGASLRWLLGLWLNPTFQHLPLGTLVANLIGGLVMGVMIGLVSAYDAIPPAWRLFAMTGALGGLTTFSTFSAEVGTMLLRGQFAIGVATIGLHVLGSLALTVGGYWAVHATLPLLRG